MHKILNYYLSALVTLTANINKKKERWSNNVNLNSKNVSPFHPAQFTDIVVILEKRGIGLILLLDTEIKSYFIK